MEVMILDLKHGPVLIKVHKDDRHYLTAFKTFEEIGFYEPEEMDVLQRETYEKAQAGDVAAAKELILLRAADGYEYEGFSVEDVIE